MQKVENVNPYRDDERAKGEQVRTMFDSIAPAYDFMNRAMTFGLDRVWLRKLVRSAAESGAGDVLDLATGTGDVAFALAEHMPGARITGLDLSEGMLAKARAKAAGHAAADRLTFVCGDCLATGMPDACADLITIAYGVRNFADIAGGLAEMYRLLRPGGRLLVLELSEPSNAVMRGLYRFYSRTVIPALGRLVSGDRRAYSYLLESIAACPPPQQMRGLMASAGFGDCSLRSLTFGVCTLYTACKKA